MTTVKISGTKATVKRPAPQEPANVRPVSTGHGWDTRHTHLRIPPSLVRKNGLSRRRVWVRLNTIRMEVHYYASLPVDQAREE